MNEAVKKAKAYLKRPGNFFRYQSESMRHLYSQASRLLHPRTYLSRCQQEWRSEAPFEIEPQKGYTIIQPEQFPDNLAMKVVDEVNGMLKAVDLEAIRREAKKNYLITAIQGEDIPKDSYIYQLMTHPLIVGSVAKYLKCFPLLTYVAVWYSPNDTANLEGSQKFHIDHEDYYQVKGFLLINEIGEKSGPFTFLPASECQKVQDTLDYRMTPGNKQVDDDVMYSVVDKGRTIPLTGKPGTVAMVDTSHCFHYGSREGSQPRIMLAFQYMTPFAFTLPWLWQRKKLLPHLHGKLTNDNEKRLFGLKI